MFTTSILVASGVTVAAHPPFEDWAAEWGINGPSESMRRKYEDNCKEMDQLDQEHPGATFEVNEFSGMTYEEFSDKFLMAIPEPAEDNVPSLRESNRPKVPPADAVFWPITSIRSQTCGSCWIYASLAMIESGAVSRGLPPSLKLSEKEILDCSGHPICEAGRPEQAFTALAGKDIYTEESCPWASDLKEDCGVCSSRGAVPSGVTITGYHRAPASTDAALVQELQHDTVTVMIFANQAFMHGWTGIDTNPATQDCSPNHVVLVMGYDFRGPVPYWQIKNSWGPSWGESGTVRVKTSMEGCGPYSMFKDHLVQADGISAFPVETGWCCADVGCAYATCFGDDQHCTQVGADGCASDCGGTWCPRKNPTTVTTTPAPLTTTPAPPAEWCCQNSNCEADSTHMCFPVGSFCTDSGKDKCVQNCGGTWCSTGATTPAPLTEWCCQDTGCAVDTCFDETQHCTQVGKEGCAHDCGGTWCPRTPAPAPAPGTEWCCQDAGCAVESCFDDTQHCTQVGKAGCAHDCGGTWCPRTTGATLV